MKAGRNSRGALVCFVGIDGAGKTTIAKMLLRHVREHGLRSRYVWGGFKRFTLFRPFVAFAQALMLDADRHLENSHTKGRQIKNSFISSVYHHLVLLDYVIQVLFNIGVPLHFGETIICDRYVYDVVASIGVSLDYHPKRILKLLDRCLSFLPKPDMVFLIDLPEPMAYQRKNDIVSVDFLSLYREIFLEMGRRHVMTILDGRMAPQQLEELVETEVMRYLVEGTPT